MDKKELKTIKSLELIPQMPIWGMADVLFLDVDYTVLDFESGHRAGLEAVSGLLEMELSTELSRIFYKILATRRGEMDPDDEFYRLTDTTRGPIWSRERMILLAATNIGKSIYPEKVAEATNAYWLSLANNSPLYPDAKIFLDLAVSDGKKMIWVTDSDHRMIFNEDKQSFNYNPDFSRKSKIERLKDLLSAYPGKCIVGDPMGKPEMWQDVLSNVSFNIERSIAIGDGINDVSVPIEYGSTGILIRR
jgi:FMN phosphatase YigB (HAD superfamily)